MDVSVYKVPQVLRIVGIQVFLDSFLQEPLDFHYWLQTGGHRQRRHDLLDKGEEGCNAGRSKRHLSDLHCLIQDILQAGIRVLKTLTCHNLPQDVENWNVEDVLEINNIVDG
jgi:hypothetical protein